MLWSFSILAKHNPCIMSRLHWFAGHNDDDVVVTGYVQNLRFGGKTTSFQLRPWYVPIIKSKLFFLDPGKTTSFQLVHHINAPIIKSTEYPKFSCSNSLLIPTPSHPPRYCRAALFSTRFYLHIDAESNNMTLWKWIHSFHACAYYCFADWKRYCGPRWRWRPRQGNVSSRRMDQCRFNSMRTCV